MENKYHLPRFIPKGDKPRIDWYRQLTTEYQAKYKGVGTFNSTPTLPAIPEPSTWFLPCAGLGVLPLPVQKPPFRRFRRTERGPLPIRNLTLIVSVGIVPAWKSADSSVNSAKAGAAGEWTGCRASGGGFIGHRAGRR
jgi:hypothetical protein